MWNPTLVGLALLFYFYLLTCLDVSFTGESYVFYIYLYIYTPIGRIRWMDGLMSRVGSANAITYFGMDGDRF